MSESIWHGVRAVRFVVGNQSSISQVHCKHHVTSTPPSPELVECWNGQAEESLVQPKLCSCNTRCFESCLDNVDPTPASIAELVRRVTE